MALTISLANSEIADEIKGKYKSFTHDEKIPSAGEGGNVSVENKTGISNTVTPDIQAIIDSVAYGVYLKVKKDLDAIKTQIDSMVSTFNTHTHSNGNQGAPTGSPASPMT